MQQEQNTSNRIDTAVLLAAGMGTRLHVGVDPQPKCLTAFDSNTILGKLLEELVSLGFQRLVIVTGFQQEKIRSFVEANDFPIAIEYVYNEDYANSNNIVSLWCARDLINEPFMLIESDLVFAPGMLKPFLQPDRMAISELRQWMNGTTVSLAENNAVGKMHVAVPIYGDSHFKTVNVYSLSIESWLCSKRKLEQLLELGKTDIYYEQVFALLIDSQEIAMEAVLFDADQWYEIDTQQDLLLASNLATG